jgi:cytochrome c oxidase subunit 3
MLVGLVSLTFFFGALILAFGLRIEQEHTWRHFTVPGLLWLGTALLAISSWTLEAGRHALRHAWVAIYRGRILATVMLALLFLCVQIACAWDLLEQGVVASGNPHGSVFYLFMGIHGVHLCGGLVWLGYLFGRSSRLFSGTETDLRSHRRALSAAAIYWHFMGTLWLVLYFFLRLWTAG